LVYPSYCSSLGSTFTVCSCSGQNRVHWIVANYFTGCWWYQYKAYLKRNPWIQWLLDEIQYSLSTIIKGYKSSFCPRRRVTVIMVHNKHLNLVTIRWSCEKIKRKCIAMSAWLKNKWGAESTTVSARVFHLLWPEFDSWKYTAVWLQFHLTVNFKGMNHQKYHGDRITLLERASGLTLPNKAGFRWVSPFNNTWPITDGAYWTSRKTSFKQIQLSSLNIVSLVYVANSNEPI
jgi:hypothetical protein